MADHVSIGRRTAERPAGLHSLEGEAIAALEEDEDHRWRTADHGIGPVDRYSSHWRVRVLQVRGLVILQLVLLRFHHVDDDRLRRLCRSGEQLFTHATDTPPLPSRIVIIHAIRMTKSGHTPNTISSVSALSSLV